MAAPLFTIKVRAGKALVDRIERMGGELGLSPTEFVRFALEKELRRQELRRLQEDVTLEEIRQNVLGGGQSATVHLEEEEQGEETAVCQLCLTTFPRRGRRVDGPMLCDECLGIARGPDLSRVEPEP